MNSILYVFLPCKKVYPIGVTYLADFVHRRRPEIRQQILDLRPAHGWLRWLYDRYSFKLLPWIGTAVAQDRTGVYEYLPASIRAFPDQEGLSEMLRGAGFREVDYHNKTGGIVAIHVAIK